MLDCFVCHLLSKRIWLFLAGALVLVVFATGLLLSNYRKTLFEEREARVEKLVENAYNVLAYYHRKIEKESLKEEDAKAYALDSIRNLELADKGYFWIMDTTPRMIMHPIKPELNGTDLSTYLSPDGRYLFKEMVALSQGEKGSFVHYVWTKPGEPEHKLYPKISYIRRFEPWNWIVGSGVYVEDVDAAFWNASYVAGGLTLAVLLFFVALAMTVCEGLKRE